MGWWITDQIGDKWDNATKGAANAWFDTSPWGMLYNTNKWGLGVLENGPGGKKPKKKDESQGGGDPVRTLLDLLGIGGIGSGISDGFTQGVKNIASHAPDPAPVTPQRRRRGAAPNPVMQAVAAAQGSVQAPTKMTRKEQERLINQSIRDARRPFDQAIQDTRLRLGDQLQANRSLVDNIHADTGGLADRNKAVAAKADQNAQEAAARAMADNDLSKYGGIQGGGDAATQAAQAADGRINAAQAQAAGIKQAGDMQLMAAADQASGINSFLKASESQNRGDLQKQANRSVDRMRRERAAAINQARAVAQSQIMDTNYGRQKDYADQQNQAVQNALAILGIQRQYQADQNAMRNAALDRQASVNAARAKADAANRPSVQDWVAASTAQVRVPFDSNGDGTPDSWGYANRFTDQQLAPLNPFPQATQAQPPSSLGSLLGQFIFSKLL